MTASTDPLAPARLEAIELAATLAQRLGFPRTVGQVYGLLFTATNPLSLDAIAEALTLSKTSVSTATRELLGLSAIRQVWPPGERKDHYEARTDLREVLKANYFGSIKPPLERAQDRLDTLVTRFETDHAEGRIDDSSHATALARLDQIRRIHTQIRDVLPLLERLL